MTVFDKIRNIRGRKARSAMAVAIVAWLGFLLQPCVMAASLAGTADVTNGVELSIVTHHGPAIPTEQCLHCDDAGESLPGSCDEIVASGNSSTSKPADSGMDCGNAAAPAGMIPDIWRTAPQPLGPPQAEDLPSPVAFTEAYCVYLE
jgi:hypothetical protein